MSDQFKEIKELVDGINTGFNEIKSTVNEVKKDALTEEKLDKVVNDVTAKMDELQKMQAEEKAKRETLEAVLSRTNQSKGADKEEMEAKAKKAFADFFRKGEFAEGIKNIGGAGKDGIEIRSMSTDVDPDGGYLVRPELADFVVGRAFETSPLRQVARVITTGSKSIEVLVDDDEATATWTGEGSASSNTTTPVLGQKEITAFKLDAEPRMTIEMMQDAYLDVEAWLRDKVADKFARTENTAFVTGNGVAKPRGFLTYDAWTTAGTYERDKIEQVSSGSAAALTADGLIELQNSLKEVYQPNAVFLMKRNTFGAVLKQKGNDNYFFSPVLLKDGQAQMQLLGKRVIFADDMPAVAANALSIAYGDFGVGYTIVDRVGLQVLRDPYSNKGFMTYYTTKRVGGDVTNFDAIKIQKVEA